MVTKDEFELQYAAASGLSLKDLRELGGHAVPCTCEWDDCPGWTVSFEDSEGEGEDELAELKFAPMRKQPALRD